MLLDDNLEYCLQMMALLSKDFKPYYATTSAKFLEKAKTKSFDLFMVDYALHEKKNDGLKVIKSLRRNPSTSNAAILMVSGVDDSTTLRKAFVSGIDDFIIKPVIPDYLIPKIENLLFQNRKKIQSQALTGLPGNKLIEEEFKSRFQTRKAFSAAYIDLDNFKPFNDEKGVDKGDKAILAMSNLLWETRNFYSRTQLFLGHLGGDDFFLIGTKQAVTEAVQILQQKFRKTIAPFFTPAEINRGWYSATGRDGQKHKYNLLSFSAAILHIPREYAGHFSGLAVHFSRLKKSAKKDPQGIAQLRLPQGNTRYGRDQAGLFSKSRKKDRNSIAEEADKKTWA